MYVQTVDLRDYLQYTHTYIQDRSSTEPQTLFCLEFQNHLGKPQPTSLAVCARQTRGLYTTSPGYLWKVPLVGLF